MKTLLKTIAASLHEGKPVELHPSTARILWTHIHKTGRREGTSLHTEQWTYEFRKVVRRRRKLVIVTATEKEVAHA